MWSIRKSGHNSPLQAIRHLLRPRQSPRHELAFFEQAAAIGPTGKAGVEGQALLINKVLLMGMVQGKSKHICSAPASRAKTSATQPHPGAMSRYQQNATCRFWFPNHP